MKIQYRSIIVVIIVIILLLHVLSKPKDECPLEFSVTTEGSPLLPFTVTLSGNVVIEMLPIEGGTFQMGNPEPTFDAQGYTTPFKQETVDSFWIQSTETTNAMYLAFLQEAQYNGASDADEGYLMQNYYKKIEYVPERLKFLQENQWAMFANDDSPVVLVSLKNAIEFCKWISNKSGRRFRLPTEVEWEYACRGGSDTRYSFGDSPYLLGKYAHYAKEPNLLTSATVPVKTKLPNKYGVYGMHGNVSEWVMTDESSIFPQKGENAVLRGGCWSLFAENCTSYFRKNCSPTATSIMLGFRVVSEP